MKFSGKVGFATIKETAPGVWSEVIADRKYVGDITRLARSLQASQSINDNVNLNNQISIVADMFAYENFFNIRYVVWCKSKWKVTNVEVKRPRLILTLGGVYNDGN